MAGTMCSPIRLASLEQNFIKMEKNSGWATAMFAGIGKEGDKIGFRG